MRLGTTVCTVCHATRAADAVSVCPSCGTPDPDSPTLFTRVSAAVNPTDGPESATALTPATAVGLAGPLLAPPQRSDEIGRLGHYRVLGRLGSGGMGLVFRAEDPHLRRLVALKVMLPQFAADPLARARFGREARAAAAVEHDHIVPIFQVGEDRGIPYLAMPLLKGESLATRIKAGGPLPLFHAVRIAREVADGLAAAHAAGLIHRDIKPSNIWLEGHRRRVRLLDFGLARSIEGVRPDSNPTLDRDVVGTPAYMSPEQAQHDQIDGRSDLFSLGVVLYQMVAGQSPFKTGSAIITLTSVALDDPQPPADLNPELPPELNALILGLLAKRPGDRPASAAEVSQRLADLEVELTAVPLSAIPPAAGDPFADLADQADSSTTVRRPAGIRWGRLAGLGLAAFGVSVAASALAAFLYLPAPLGTLVIDSDDPKAEVVVWRDGALVQERTRSRQLPLPAGVYAVELVDPRDGDRVSPDSVRIARAGRAVVRVHRERQAPPAPLPDPDRKTAGVLLDRRCILKVVPADGKELEVKSKAALPGDPFRVTGVTFPPGATVRSDVLKRLAGLEQLTALGLTETPLGDAEVRALADLKGLTSLAVVKAGLTNSGLKHLAGLTRMTMLFIDANPVTDAGLAELAEMKELAWLGLSGTGVGDDGLAHLARFSKLSLLNLNDTAVTNQGLKHLAGLPGLRLLALARTQVSDAGLEQLARRPDAPALTALDLTGTRITNEGLGHLAKFKSLTSLTVTAPGVTEAEVRKLAASRPDCKIVWADKIFGTEPK